MARLQYLLPVLHKKIKRQDTLCPHCDCANTSILGTKHFVVQLRKCQQCGLCFRWPKDSIDDNSLFYSGIYREDGLVVDLPSIQKLEELKNNHFRGTDQDFSARIEVLKRYKTSGRLLDYGASWGYGTWQLEQAGYDTVGFEIDTVRAQYGQDHLQIDMMKQLSDFDNLPEQSFDIVFTSHVLEHLPNLQTVFSQFHKILRHDGILLITVPNSTGIEQSSVFAVKKSFAFGEKHTFAFTADFFTHNLPRHGFRLEMVTTSPYDGPPHDLVEGGELLAIVRK